MDAGDADDARCGEDAGWVDDAGVGVFTLGMLGTLGMARMLGSLMMLWTMRIHGCWGC